MAKEPKILLIYPPCQFQPIETPRPDGSLGLLYLCGALEQAGFKVDLLDATVGAKEDNLQDTFYNKVKQSNGLIRIGMPPERIKKFIARGGYNIIGINSSFTSQTKMVLDVAAIAKSANPDILTIAGGVSARSLSERLLDGGDIDVVCLSEGEKIIVRLVQEWIQGRGFEHVSGIRYKKNGQYITHPATREDVYANLDELPFPAWHKLPFEHYDSISFSRGSALDPNKVRSAPIMTSRGCLFKCRYCHISLEKEDNLNTSQIGFIRFKSVERVLEEVKRLKELKVHRLYFEDDCLFAKKDRVRTIFEKIMGMGFKIASVNGVNLIHFQRQNEKGETEIDVEFLKFLRQAGFDEITFPVESGCQRIIDKYATAKINLATLDIAKIIKTTASLGIQCPLNIMIGFPDETEEEIMQSVAFGKKLVAAGADYCSFFITIPFPGSKLYETAIKEGYLSPDFNSDSMNWQNPIMKNTAVPPERILELREWAWRTVNRPEYVQARLKKNIVNDNIKKSL